MLGGGKPVVGPRQAPSVCQHGQGVVLWCRVKKLPARSGQWAEEPLAPFCRAAPRSRHRRSHRGAGSERPKDQGQCLPTPKARTEDVLLAANGCCLSTVAIRPPFIWGADMPALDHMVQTVKAGQFQWVAGGGQALSTCHVENQCHALILAADHGAGAYFVSDGEDTTLKSVLSRLLAARGITAKDRSVPFGLAWSWRGRWAWPGAPCGWLESRRSQGRCYG
ncbi:MAG: hypothetical protein V4586_04200 [Pseudomonadota bacterium]